MPDQPLSDDFRLPDLGEGLTEAEIVAWHVAEGDHVVADQPLVTVETDKAVVDIPAPHGGQVQRLHAAVGDRLAVGALLVTLTGGPDTHRESTAVVGELPSTTLGAPRSPSRISASPKARQRARELGVDLRTIRGTGPDQSIGVQDVEQAADPKAAPPPSRQLSGVRRAMAQRMADAHARVARATVTGEADVTNWGATEKPILRLIRAVGVACTAMPILNARFDDSTYTLTEQAQVNLGIAMETSDGLFVPVIRDVNARDVNEVEQDLERLEREVLDRTIDLRALRDQSITLSNFGAVGGLHAEMMVVPPQVAIVGAGRIFDRPPRRILPLSISFDHRAVTGVEACEFMSALTGDLELTS